MQTECSGKSCFLELISVNHFDVGSRCTLQMLIKPPSRAESVPSAPSPCGLASVSCTVPRVILPGLRLWDLLRAASAGPRHHRSHPASAEAREAAEEAAMGFTFVEAGSRRVEGKSPGERSLWFLPQLLHSFN